MKNKGILLCLLFVVLIGFSLFNSFYSEQIEKTQPRLAETIRETAKVLRVIDGDTIEVLVESYEDTVRLIGIDSPETLDERKPIQCFGKEAFAKADEILTNKTVTLESDPTQGNKDEYKRLLRYVFLLDGTNFNEFMIKEGYAREYTFKGSSYKYQLEFRSAEKKAKQGKEGLWGSCN